MNKKQLKKVAKTLATLVLETMAWEEPFDGDDTEYLTAEFLKELDSLMGNE